MPNIVEKNMNSYYLQQGDRLKGYDSTIVKVDKKREYVHVTMDSGTKKRISLQEHVAFFRSEPTQEEIRDVQRITFVHSIRRTRDAWCKKTFIENAKEKLERYEEGVSGYLYNHWDLDKMLEEQVALLMMERFDYYLGNAKEFVDEDTATLVAWYDAVFTEDSRTRNPLSRSTSATSNLFEDLICYRRAELIRSTHWLSEEVCPAMLNEAVAAYKAAREAARDNKATA